VIRRYAVAVMLLAEPAERGTTDMTQPARRQNTATASWAPFDELQQVYAQLRPLIEAWDQVYFSRGTDEFVPSGDVEETDEGYVVEVELPGVKKDDIELSLEGRRLRVEGVRKEKERTGILRRRTRAVGRFRYEIVLPGPVDEERVSASLGDGVLTVLVPKAASERQRRIRVT